MIRFDYRKTFGQEVQIFLKAQLSGDAVTAVLGASGSGKTTLAKLLAGIEKPDSGFCEINGTVFDDTSRGLRLKPEERRVGFVFQNHRLFPHLNVRDNILYPVRYGKREPLLAFDQLVQLLHIEHLVGRLPMTLSGGEAQRVALARAFCSTQNMLILDEPTASLDPHLREELTDCVSAIAREARFPIIYITHSGREALKLAPNAIFLRNGRVTDAGQTRDILSRYGYLLGML